MTEVRSPETNEVEAEPRPDLEDVFTYDTHTDAFDQVADSRLLAEIADRLGVLTVSRVVYLLTASLRSTHDVAPILDVIARDSEARNELLDRRHESIQSYVVVVFVGVLVFRVIVAHFELSFLPTLQRFAERGATGLRRTPLRLGEIGLVAYRRLLFHAGLVQAVGNGLLLGKMVDNDLYSGLKYANVLLLVVVALFWALL